AEDGKDGVGIAVFGDKGIIRESWRCRTDTQRAGDEYASMLAPLMHLVGMNFADVSDTIISSVVPDANFQIRSFCKKYLKKDPIFVTKD
ncbi:type III pantothenate kinase, partial [Staphylococcus aureus]|nr:type III pantothenate kinase [Staphylococcus aureus]